MTKKYLNYLQVNIQQNPRMQPKTNTPIVPDSLSANNLVRDR